MNYYQNYRTAHLTLKIRAIYINNMLSEMDVSDNLSGYLPSWCGVDTDYLEMKVYHDNVVHLTYYIPYEDNTDEWTVYTKYIEMDDEAIKKDWMELIQSQYAAEVDRQDQQLKRLADSLGYGLFRKDLV